MYAGVYVRCLPARARQAVPPFPYLEGLKSHMLLLLLLVVVVAAPDRALACERCSLQSFGTGGGGGGWDEEDVASQHALHEQGCARPRCDQQPAVAAEVGRCV